MAGTTMAADPNIANLLGQMQNFQASDEARQRFFAVSRLMPTHSGQQQLTEART